MHTTGLLYRKCGRGTSTVLGTLIFVGIMFTAVIPMLLVMNQANTLYEIRKVEVGRIDEEHAMESIFFHLETSIEPDLVTGIDEPIMTLVVYNRCEIAVKIIHVWINGVLREVDYLIPPTGDDSWVLEDFVDYDTEEPVSFSVMAVTDRGNILLPPSGNPKYSYDSDLRVGSWEHDVYTIYIMMTHKKPQLHILVNYTVADPDIPDITVFNDGVGMNLDGYLIGVPYEGTYLVVVTQFFDELRREHVTVGPTRLAALVIV